MRAQQQSGWGWLGTVALAVAGVALTVVNVMQLGLDPLTDGAEVADVAALTADVVAEGADEGIATIADEAADSEAAEISEASDAAEGEDGFADVDRSGGGGSDPDDVPDVIYRTGSRTPESLTDEDGVSFRDSVSSSADGRQVFRPGDKIWAVQTDQLPADSVDPDNDPPGHVTVNATPEEIQNAVIPTGPDNPLDEMFKALEEDGSYRIPKK